jgi:hypothetical protein
MKVSRWLFVLADSIRLGGVLNKVEPEWMVEFA